MNNTSKLWYEEFDSSRFNTISKLYYERFFKNIPNIDNLKVLDYACGIGQGTALLNNVIYYDKSEDAIKIAKKHNINVLNNLDLIEDNSFDIVFCCTSLEHCLEPRTELKNMYKKLKKGGKLILIVTDFANEFPVGGSYTHLKEKIYFDRFDFHPCGWYYNWNFTGLNNLLISVGFKVVDNKRVGYKGSRFFEFIKNFKLYFWLINFTGMFFKKTQMYFEAEK